MSNDVWGCLEVYRASLTMQLLDYLVQGYLNWKIDPGIKSNYKLNAYDIFQLQKKRWQQNYMVVCLYLHDCPSVSCCQSAIKLFLYDWINWNQTWHAGLLDLFKCQEKLDLTSLLSPPLKSSVLKPSPIPFSLDMRGRGTYSLEWLRKATSIDPSPLPASRSPESQEIEKLQQTQ